MFGFVSWMAGIMAIHSFPKRGLPPVAVHWHGYGDGQGVANVSAGSHVYDQIESVTNTVVRKDTSATIDSETFTYIYDDNGNITIIRRDGLEMLRYGYDEL